MWSRFIVIVLLLHVPLYFYPILRLAYWLESPWWLTAPVFVILGGSQMISRFYLRGRTQGWAIAYRKLGDFWLGLSPILLATLLVGEIAVAFAMAAPANAALAVIAFSLLVGVAGVVVAINPFVRRISFSSPRLKAPVRFVQITDVHIGSRSPRFLEGIVAQINRLEADFLCITGDFIDATGVPESDLVSLKSLNCPVYFCIGNHEKYEDLDDILVRLGNLGVRILRNAETRYREDLQIIGIDDMDDNDQVGRELRAIDVDQDAFSLLLYHRPHGLEAAAEAGIDLMLSGHTHNGQIVPFNLVVGRVFDRVAGMYEYDDSRQYVSQGTGTWGPVMRVGTRAEITLFELSASNL